MQYPVGNDVIIAALISPGTTEYSRAVDLGADNNASFECKLLSITSGGSIANFEAALQGSNDLANWTTITTTTTTAVPDVLVNSYSSSVPWGYVRLKYTAASTGSATVVVASAINTAKVGG